METTKLLQVMSTLGKFLLTEISFQLGMHFAKAIQ